MRMEVAGMNPGKWTMRKQLSMADGFVMLFLIFILMNGIVGSGILPVEWLSGFLPGGATVINKMLIQQIFQTLLMVGIVLLFLRMRGATLQQIGLRPFQDRRWFYWSVMWGGVTFFAMLFVSACMVKLFPNAEPQTATELIMHANGQWENFAVILMVSVLAPFSEELVFRGYIYRSLRMYKSQWFSILAASLMFGCMHYDLFRLLPLTLVGIFLNVTAVRSESLWGSMIMHGVWNFMMASLVLAV
ncbi:MAG: CPBP family intramembrane metalloprotease [Peptococcaceae bacterium]|nr:CPBP family intramembrane metalloprotease [Peptococcaceae bacterium]